MVKVMYLAAVLPKDYRNDPGVMYAETAIEMATINGARSDGPRQGDRLARRGKRADVIVINMWAPEWVPNYSECRTSSIRPTAATWRPSTSTAAW